MNLPVLNFPDYPFQLRETGGKTEIFDPVRRQWVRLSPEEWVRQHCIRYFHHEIGVPFSLMSIEKKLVVGGFERRYDLLVFNRAGKPVLLTECKAPGIDIRQSALEQACIYNQRLKVELLFVSNGIRHFCIRVNTDCPGFSFLESLPENFLEE